jgi:hypothetical protein
LAIERFSAITVPARMNAAKLDAPAPARQKRPA